MKVKTRHKDGPRYRCGHRAYVMSSRLIAMCAVMDCADCRDVTLPWPRKQHARPDR